MTQAERLQQLFRIEDAVGCALIDFINQYDPDVDFTNSLPIKGTEIIVDVVKPLFDKLQSEVDDLEDVTDQLNELIADAEVDVVRLEIKCDKLQSDNAALKERCEDNEEIESILTGCLESSSARIEELSAFVKLVNENDFLLRGRDDDTEKIVTDIKRQAAMLLPPHKIKKADDDK